MTWLQAREAEADRGRHPGRGPWALWRTHSPSAATLSLAGDLQQGFDFPSHVWGRAAAAEGELQPRHGQGLSSRGPGTSLTPSSCANHRLWQVKGERESSSPRLHSPTTLTCNHQAPLGSQGPGKGTGNPGQGRDPPRLLRRRPVGLKTALERGNLPRGPELRGGARPPADDAGNGDRGGGLGPVQAPLRAPTAPKAYFRLGSHDRPRRHAGASPPANQRSALRSHSLPPPR